MKRLPSLGEDHSRLSIKIGLLLIIVSNTINNFVGYFDPMIATISYFLVLAIAYVLIGFGVKTMSKIGELFYWLSIGHLIDELIGRGSIFDWYEIIIGVLTILYVYRRSFIKGFMGNN